MIYDSILLLAQTAMVMLQACWLTLGVYSNLRWPRTNKDYVHDVVTMELTKENPAVYEDHKHRQVTSQKLIDRMFKAIAVVELLVTFCLWSAVAALLLAVVGILEPSSARAIGLLAVTGFALIWGGFLVGGQWFHYWVSERSPQSTHFFMLLWALATLIFLTQGV